MKHFGTKINVIKSYCDVKKLKWNQNFQASKNIKTWRFHSRLNLIGKPCTDRDGSSSDAGSYSAFIWIFFARDLRHSELEIRSGARPPPWPLAVYWQENSTAPAKPKDLVFPRLTFLENFCISFELNYECYFCVKLHRFFWVILVATFQNNRHIYYLPLLKTLKTYRILLYHMMSGTSM